MRGTPQSAKVQKCSALHGSLPPRAARPQYAEQGAQAQQPCGGAQTLRRGEAYGMLVISWFVLIRRLVRVGVFYCNGYHCEDVLEMHFCTLHFCTFYTIDAFYLKI